METKLNNTLDQFLSDEQDVEFNKKVKEDKIKFMRKNDSIIERVDKIILDESGRQLLREVY